MPVQPQPARGDRQRRAGHVDADDLGERAGPASSSAQQRALAAAEVEHPGGPAAPQRGRGPPRRRCTASGAGVLLGVRLVVVDRVVELLRLRRPRSAQPAELEPLERLSGQRPAAGQVAAGDQLLLGVAGEPALAGPQQLVDLVGATQ